MGPRAGRRQDADAIENVRNEKPQRRRRAGRYIKPNEVRRLFAAAASGTDPIGGARDAALLALLCGAGLRRSQAAALQLADYDQVSGAITIRRDDEEVVYATNGGKEAIDAWIARRGPWLGTMLCPVKGRHVEQRAMTAQSVMARVRTIAKRAGVDQVTPNDLRRTYLTELDLQQITARTKGRPEEVLALEMLSVPYEAP